MACKCEEYGDNPKCFLHGDNSNWALAQDKVPGAPCWHRDNSACKCAQVQEIARLKEEVWRQKFLLDSWNQLPNINSYGAEFPEALAGDDWLRLCRRLKEKLAEKDAWIRSIKAEAYGRKSWGYIVDRCAQALGAKENE